MVGQWASDDQVIAAVKALRLTTDDKLWASDSPVQINFGLGLITDLTKDFRPKTIPLPSPLLPANADVCLVVKDSIDNTLFQKLKLSGKIKKVIRRKKFAANYQDFQERQKLVGRFDLFLVERGVRDCGTIFGKSFFSTKKVPVPITVADADAVLKKVEELKSSALYIKCAAGGTSVTIKAARLDLTDDEVVNNIQAVLKYMRPIFGSKVQSISIKTADSISLPIYQNIVVRPVRVGMKRKAPRVAVPNELESEEGFEAAAKQVRILTKAEEKSDILPKWHFSKPMGKVSASRTIRTKR